LTAQDDVVFLLDCDNTLFDNDAFQDDLRDHLTSEFGLQRSDRFFAILEQMSAELGYVDYLGAVQRYRLRNISDARVLLMSTYLLEYPFATRLYPGALDVVRRLRNWGLTVVLSDGDAVFQPRKIQRSGLWEAVEGRVLIYVHKEEMLDALAARYPARHYVIVEDKVRILSAMKMEWNGRLTTIFVRQGHYALDRDSLVACPRPDLTVERIGQLLDYDPEHFRRPSNVIAGTHSRG
jgi:FMN phosphatase YigB (HAD superfamily)